MRRRILLLVVGMTTLVVLAFAIPLTVLIRNKAYDDGLTSLRNEANDIARYLREDNSAKTTTQIKNALANLDHDRYASVQLPGGTVLGRTPPGGLGNAPPPQQLGFGGRGGSSTGPSASPVPGSSASASAGAPVGSGRQPGGPIGDLGGPGRELDATPFLDGRIVQLRVPTFSFGTGAQAGHPTQQSQGDLYTVRVYADDGELHSGETGSLLLLGGMAVLLLAVGVVAGEILTRRIVRPLVDTAGTAQRLSSGDTSARAPTAGPREVADVGLALNRLADRIDQLIAEERETVADLSHRLRTPLTALRLDAEALTDPADAERVGTHVSTLERMLTAVIHAARRPQREGRLPSCDATAVVGERVGFWSALAEDQERPSTIDLPSAPLLVRSGPEDLAAAVDALVENVIAHTPEGTAFGVTLAATDGGARLTVTDHGPGLPLDAPVRGRSDRGSSGLGLDIARRCAASSGGSMTLGSSASGGASISLELRSP